ncbi:MAG TPA: AsnC family transcriptional regulator [Deltaproteobacteria bacterium]|nr:AsnC family transcriptional regulator [Deltaproteobacteria bacterium]
MKLDDIDRELLDHVQGDLEICEAPFAPLAERLGIGIAEVITRLRAMKEQGVIREIKAVLRHRKAGFAANAMVVWAVSGDRVDEVGAAIAARPEVSHCYEREGFAPYTVFSMVHAHSDAELDDAVRAMAAETAVDDYRIYRSVTELKKTSMRYSFHKT